MATTASDENPSQMVPIENADRTSPRWNDELFTGSRHLCVSGMDANHIYMTFSSKYTTQKGKQRVISAL